MPELNEAGKAGSHAPPSTTGRKLVGESHEGKYTYWFDPKDKYVYQWATRDGMWRGYLCHVSAWNNVYRHAKWMLTYSANEL